MKKIILSFLILGFTIALHSPSLASTEPRDGQMDARIKTFDYNDNAVYRFKGHYGFSTVIEFSPRETIDSVSIGDSEAWQIVPSNKSNILFIKPILENAYTNMTVLTSHRIYSFEMSAGKAASHKSDELVFRVKFNYPDEKKKHEFAEKKEYDPFEGKDNDDFNFRYSYAGSNRLKPVRAFDDGKFTYLRFKNFTSMPAVFAVDEDGKESLVNFTMKDEYMVISSIGAQFTLRDGDIATCIFNDLLQTEDTIQKEPAAIDASITRDMAIPLPKEKPYFTAKNKDSFIGKIGSIFEGDNHYSNQSGELNQ